ncbi:hypothetical protein [Ureibacillus acetophenoni]|uniref:Uncharacterized protein n=1 Tax=Ureibacillus acetophenoni TaxID=614649 RepID=A0A285UPH2_9BACL|nr:hypothetical protein [Ureibacillus acetophenoni]SOC43719.1 hypothetical protein SAMN05877842_11724 [Ureibacillus acetophenoni]
MKFFNTLDIIYFFVMSLLLVYDFFPNFPFADSVPTNVLIPLILVLMVLSILLKQYNDKSKKDLLKAQIFWTIYLLLLIVILTVLGGQSKTGIALDNGVLWIAVLISLVGPLSRWRKLKNSEE